MINDESASSGEWPVPRSGCIFETDTYPPAIHCQPRWRPARVRGRLAEFRRFGC
jgi:hypothetical protein